MTLPQPVADLVDRFHRNRDAYLSGQYNETQVRHEFIDPMFESLGWDINNRRGYAEAYKDVIHEDAIKVGGATKAPDYCFRVGGTRKFFLEAKKPSVRIHDDVSPTYQLRRYAWSAKLPLSVLTDFEEFALYDCRVRPALNDSPATARVMYVRYSEYEHKWDEIEAVLSRDAILKGSFDKYADSKRAKRGTAEVDAEFLKEIEAWRDALARNIAIRNKELGPRELNAAVQQTIDRIIFLRLCEDRGIETYGCLQQHLNGDNVYARLMEVFRAADDRYNSGLFHFRPEKDRPDYDRLTPTLNIDDKVLKDIINRLYYPDSPYEFSVLPADILGQVYEQFLGKVIRLTKGHQAKVEEKPEVRKAGGVYYTPTYIVDYIVKNTVGKLLEGKTPKDIDGAVGSRTVGSRTVGSHTVGSRTVGSHTVGSRTVGSRSRATAPPLRVLDPACGSGSFLINAYQFLLDWYRDQYANEPEKYTRARSPRIYQRGHNDYALTAQERKRILIDHIYGVDIDPQAVEVTKLSLLLKVLEGENAESIGKTILMFHERALPDLNQNVKCGNSLIGPDFYNNQQTDLFDEEEMYRINAFDWNHEFPFLPKDTGFDAVIGNPPYVRQESLADFKDYFQHTYKSYTGTSDLYVPFIEKAVSLLRSNGYFSYIVGNKWMRANYGKPLRQWMVQQGLEEIIDFGDLPVFKNATTYPCILRIAKKAPGASFDAVNVDTLAFQNLTECVAQRRFHIAVKNLNAEGWALVSQREQDLLNKIGQAGVPLSKYVDGKIYRGIVTGLNKAFVIDLQTRNRLVAEDPHSAEIIKPFLVGKDIRRYQHPASDRFVIFTRRGIDIRAFPAIEAYLAAFKKELMPRPLSWGRAQWPGRKPGPYQWYEIQDTVEYYPVFELPKIIWPGISSEVTAFSLDLNGLYGNDNNQIIVSDDRYLLAVLNSRLSGLWLRNVCDKVQGGFYRLKISYIAQLPIHPIDVSARSEKNHKAELMLLADKMLNLNKRLQTTKTDHDRTILQRQIAATDQQIDQLVYELYGLSKEEIDIVKGSAS